MNLPPRYARALTRNLYEVRSALSERNAVNAIVEVAPTTSWSFFSCAFSALYDDMLAHAMKVLDRHKDAASFRYLYRCNTSEIEELLKKIDLTIADIEKLSENLKDIRNGTHFHIDRNGVFDPSNIWKKANISGDFFNRVIEGIWDILNHLYISLHQKPFIQSIYEGKDIKEIIEAVKKAGIKV
jgi:hypothetical protein